MLARLVDQGNTVIVIEHNLDVIKTADWIIDLGPEGGDGGGRVVAEGTPEEVAASRGSYTGEFLRPVLAQDARRAQKRRSRRASRIAGQARRPRPTCPAQASVAKAAGQQGPAEQGPGQGGPGGQGVGGHQDGQPAEGPGQPGRTPLRR